MKLIRGAASVGFGVVATRWMLLVAQNGLEVHTVSAIMVATMAITLTAFWLLAHMVEQE